MQGGCTTDAPTLQPFQECRLLSLGCVVQPEIAASGENITVQSGFPAQPLPNDVYGTPVAVVEGLRSCQTTTDLLLLRCAAAAAAR